MRLVEEDDEDDDIEETTKDQPKQLVVDMCSKFFLESIENEGFFYIF